MLAMLDFWHDLAPGGAIGAEFVGDHAFGRTTLLAQKPLQQSLGCSGVAADLDDFVEHISVLIDGAREIALFAIDRDDDFVEMPDIAPARFLSFQPASIVQTKFHRPAPNGFVRDGDPPLEQQFFDQPQAERKSKIQPNGMGDDLRRKAVAFVAIACIEVA